VTTPDSLGVATAHLQAGRLDDALNAARAVLDDDPANVAAMLLCGQILRRGGKNGDAIGVYNLILTHLPDTAAASGGLGAALGMLGRYDEAVDALRRAVALEPAYFEAWAFLGEALAQQGKTTEAMDCFERSLEIHPDNAAAVGKRLFFATFDARYDADRVFRLNRDWGVAMEERVGADILPRQQSRRDPEGRLRVGYLSDEFYERVTARFIEPVLRAHDHNRFEIFAYSRAGVRDDTTGRMEGAVDNWRIVAGMDDAAIAQRIYADNLDILVICTSYAAEFRAPLAYRPAPVQVCYSNLVSTTGLSATDYLITETLTDPPGSDAYYTEHLVRLSNRNIYAPPFGINFPTSPAPIETNGFVTFGSFNNIGKIGAEVVALWSRILRATLGSRLIMKSVNRFEDPGAVTYFRDMFAQNGIGKDRVALLGGDPDLPTHLSRYEDIDIALDPFPCNGGTTSCEALWMGAPVVTMAGDTFMGRQGVNYLTKLGLTELIAKNPDAYFTAATELAANPQRISTLRETLRSRIEARLFDPAAHVAELETAYLEMHRRYVHNAPASAFLVQGDKVEC
jgi:protein O-GlcNAc transferase